MNQPRGFALPAVLGTLVLMAMLVAVGAQHALMAMREAALAETRAETEAAAESALAQVFAAQADTVRLGGAAPGVVVDSGESRVGAATATWRVRGQLGPVASLDIDVRAPGPHGGAHWIVRAWLRCRADTAGAVRWGVAGPGWWGRFPLS